MVLISDYNVCTRARVFASPLNENLFLFTVSHTIPYIRTDRYKGRAADTTSTHLPYHYTTGKRKICKIPPTNGARMIKVSSHNAKRLRYTFGCCTLAGSHSFVRNFNRNPQPIALPPACYLNWSYRWGNRTAQTHIITFSLWRRESIGYSTLCTTATHSLCDARAVCVLYSENPFS